VFDLHQLPHVYTPHLPVNPLTGRYILTLPCWIISFTSGVLHATNPTDMVEIENVGVYVCQFLPAFFKAIAIVFWVEARYSQFLQAFIDRCFDFAVNRQQCYQGKIEYC
jgi:hypothetical protein